jgi:ribosomal protein S14
MLIERSYQGRKSMRLVHVTDLHYATGNAFQRALLKGLLADFSRLYDSGYMPDFLVFSGDLVNNPDDPGIYEIFESDFLRPALEALRLTANDAILCPGNHDISHLALRQWSDERRKLTEALGADQAGLDKHLFASPTKAYVTALSAGFFELAKRCGNAWDNPYARVYSYPGKRVSFVAINTGYGCGLEGSQFDRGKLAVSANQVLEAFQRISERCGQWSRRRALPVSNRSICRAVLRENAVSVLLGTRATLPGFHYAELTRVKRRTSA